MEDLDKTTENKNNTTTIVNVDTKFCLLDQEQSIFSIKKEKEDEDPHSKDIDVLKRALPLRRKIIEVPEVEEKSSVNKSE